MMAVQPNGAGTGENAWTPELTATTTAPDLGTGGTASGGWRYVDGALVFWWALFVFGASPDPGSGKYQLALPVTPISSNRPVAHGAVIDASASSEIRGVTAVVAPDLAAALSGEETSTFIMDTSTPAGIVAACIGDDAPFTWAEGDQINLCGIYQVG